MAAGRVVTHARAMLRTVDHCRPEPFAAMVPATPLGRRFETGTLPYELLGGFNATIRYLESIGGFDTIVPYEQHLAEHFLAALPESVIAYGPPGIEGRVPTFLVNVDGIEAAQVVKQLADLDIGVWAHDSWYALELYPQLGYEGQAIRIGFIHYNTIEEVERLLAGLASAG